MFLSPVFFSIEGAPAGFRSLLIYNPLATPIESMRSVLFWGELPDAGAFGISMLEGIVAVSFGWIWFTRTRKAFADVI